MIHFRTPAMSLMVSEVNGSLVDAFGGVGSDVVIIVCGRTESDVVTPGFVLLLFSVAVNNNSSAR